jgi:N-acetylmuramoyl-L-alanine amidase
VECGFVSNPEEAAWLKNHVSEIAQALADGIIEYLS